MKNLALAAIAVGALGATQLMTAQPAAASIEYPYCQQGALQGYPGDCSYPSFASCSYSARGTGGNCIANPRYFARGGGYDNPYDAYGYAPAGVYGDY